MKKRKIGFVLVGIALMLLFIACNSGGNSGSGGEIETPENNQTENIAENEPVRITFLNGKPEVQTAFEETARLFMDDNPHITLDIIGQEAGNSPFQTLLVLNNAGNMPAGFMVEQGDVFNFEQGSMFDFSGTQLIENASPEALAAVTTEDGFVAAAPFAAESVGFIYNRAVIEEALGREFNPNDIESNVDLRNIFQELEDAGVASVIVSPEEWSLGAHFMMYMYANQFPNSLENVAFTEELRAGNVDLMENAVFNSWMDTFDIMMEFNLESNDPLAANMDRNSAIMAQEGVAFYFMGTFTWSVLEGMGANSDDFGLMPVPVTAENDDANTRLLSIYSMYVGIDTSQNDEAQQAAALQFLEWLIYSDLGQERVMNDLGIVLAYDHVNTPAQDPLNRSLQAYMEANRTLAFNITYPSDHWQILGGYFQMYLAGVSDREMFANQIEEFWRNAQ